MAESKLQILIGSEQPQDCPICMEKVNDGQTCFTNTCKHQFCYQCLTLWSKEHNYCPLCRQLFTIMIWVSHSSHKNDFKLVIIENWETLNRRLLDSRRDTLRQQLVDESNRRQQLIANLREQIQDMENIESEIQRNLLKLDQSETQTNQIYEGILDEVSAAYDLYIDHTMSSSLSSEDQIDWDLDTDSTLTTYESTGLNTDDSNNHGELIDPENENSENLVLNEFGSD